MLICDICKKHGRQCIALQWTVDHGDQTTTVDLCKAHYEQLIEARTLVVSIFMSAPTSPSNSQKIEWLDRMLPKQLES